MENWASPQVCGAKLVESERIAKPFPTFYAAAFASCLKLVKGLASHANEVLATDGGVEAVSLSLPRSQHTLLHPARRSVRFCRGVLLPSVLWRWRKRTDRWRNFLLCL